MDKIKIGELVTLRPYHYQEFNVHPVPINENLERIDFFANEIYLYLGPIALDYGQEEIYLCDMVLFNERLYACKVGTFVKVNLDVT